MPKPDYSKLGNVSLKYKNAERGVEFAGLIVNPNLILKLYDMYVKPTKTPKEVIDKSKTFLKQEISKGHIQANIGFGIAILSDGILNVGTYDKTEPILIKNQIYTFDVGFNNPRKVSIDEEGRFCVWELGIVYHDRIAWIRYLNSNKLYNDKRAYVKNVAREVI